MLGTQTYQGMLHKIGEVKENPIRFDTMQAKQVSDALNPLLASIYTLYHQIKKHHWVVEGPQFRDLHQMLDEFAARLLKLADDLAERITVLAAYPISSPRKQQELCVFPVEEEGVFDLRFMLQNDLQAYQEIIVRYRDVIRLVANTGDFGSEHLLKAQLEQLEFDAHHLEHVLEADTLTRR
ncbi:DNA starvation/stationary phase protection protein DpsA [Brevibacillus fulvus]|uniref:DNA-binding ferritin-like protein n=1 Tax=Brevibacillus fulvus TaxID=1125967 RepID=A0A938XUY7_9BACL|nr:DNA starvation/stationary phase protection protein DpsA [Brevibacillus fulvus]MBM7588446.1 DNA-binding ferritin-like protein [Brevibacillus fulvus]